MTLEKYLIAIEEASENRDLLLDDLTDSVDTSEVSELELKKAIARLESAIGSDAIASEQESFFNFLSTIYFQGIASRLIEKIVKTRMASVGVGSLVHCVEIIAGSKLPDRDQLLKSLLSHHSAVIRNLVGDFIR